MAQTKSCALKPGDKIHIVAPCSPFDKNIFLKGVKILQAWGFKTIFSQKIFEKDDYLAGPDEQRAKDLILAINDPTAKAILFARGGYGAMRLLSYLDKTRLNKKPKIILGCSDATVLLNYFYQQFGWPTFYGPMVAGTSVNKNDQPSLSALHKALTTNKPLGMITHRDIKILRKGKTTGIMAGGCLSLITALMGTPYALDTKNKILFFEDVNEKPYQIDRMLTQLDLAETFKKCRGVVFGSLCAKKELSIYSRAIMRVLGKYKFPIIMNFPTGHGAQNITIPLGCKTTLDTTKKILVF